MIFLYKIYDYLFIYVLNKNKNIIEVVVEFVF